RNAKQGRQVEKNRLGNEDGANGLIVQRLPKGHHCGHCLPNTVHSGDDHAGVFVQLGQQVK
ncbi:hypothetical protein, partial [Pseudomonas syringae]|uniref:hypothetical protein n=1 Tax=Pseudomonas syringae TaxID=317 RepID=UPI00211DDD7B